MIKEVFQFIKNPQADWDEELTTGHKFKIFIKLLLSTMLISVAITPVTSLLEHFEILETNTHAVSELLENFNPAIVLFIAAILMPFLEEAFFRAPLLGLKKAKSFRIWVYVFVAAFAFIHITNFEMSPKILLFSPLLVLPQLNLGIFASYICLRFGYLWAVLLHGAYNFIFIGSFYAIKAFYPDLI